MLLRRRLLCGWVAIAWRSLLLLWMLLRLLLRLLHGRRTCIPRARHSLLLLPIVLRLLLLRRLLLRLLLLLLLRGVRGCCCCCCTRGLLLLVLGCLGVNLLLRRRCCSCWRVVRPRLARWRFCRHRRRGWRCGWHCSSGARMRPGQYGGRGWQRCGRAVLPSGGRRWSGWVHAFEVVANCVNQVGRQPGRHRRMGGQEWGAEEDTVRRGLQGKHSPAQGSTRLAALSRCPSMQPSSKAGRQQG